jgi:hypothetical protein
VPKLIDLTGKRLGRLVAIAYVRDGKWSCVCDCGAHTVVHGQALREGRTKSCGCGMGWRRIDLTGQRFGCWTVIAYVGRSHWLCVCDCGARVIVDGGNLRRGGSKSCGCLGRELTKTRATKHGMYGSPEYISWQHMKARCFDPQHVAYEHYGGRGISVCEDWARSFEAFFADMGSRPPGCSLDRNDPNGNYEPSNCRWPTQSSKDKINGRGSRARWGSAAKSNRRPSRIRRSSEMDARGAAAHQDGGMQWASRF